MSGDSYLVPISLLPYALPTAIKQDSSHILTTLSLYYIAICLLNKLDIVRALGVNELAGSSLLVQARSVRWYGL